MPEWKIPLFKVLMAPLSEAVRGVCDVITSGYISEGETTARFERELEHVYGAPVAAVNSCTSAMTLALKSAGIGPGHSVIVPAQTCIASATPVVGLGARVVWGDLHPHRGLLSPDDVLKKIDSTTRAVIAVHWGGDMCDVVALRDICAKRGLFLIEDAAQAFGAEAGSDFVCLSFQAVKNLTTGGDGGAVICKNEEEKSRIKKLSWFGIDRARFRDPATGEIDWTCDVPVAGFKMHMNNVTAAFGLVQLPYALYWLSEFRKNGRYMASALRDVKGLVVPEYAQNSSFWVLSLWTERRDALLKALHARGIQASQMHCRLDGYTCFKDAGGRDRLSGADEFSRGQLCVPCGPWLTEDDRQTVIQSVKEFFA